MPGTFMRASAIMPPGMFLSQPPTTSPPSIAWPLTLGSIASAITSRDTSEYFIASVPMPMPSVTVGTPNTCGLAPAASSACIARSTSGWMPALQGFIVEWPLATPTIGLSKSPSPKATPRSMARVRERAAPLGVGLELRRAIERDLGQHSRRGEGDSKNAHRSDKSEQRKRRATWQQQRIERPGKHAAEREKIAAVERQREDALGRSLEEDRRYADE